MRRLGLLLSLALVARAGDETSLQVYDLTDLSQTGHLLAAAAIRVKAAAEGHDVRFQKGTLVVNAPAAVHQKVAKELAAVREAWGMLVRVELRIVKIEGGIPDASVPGDKIDALLKEKRAESLGRPDLFCFNGQQGSVEVAKEVSYVSDFDISVDEQGAVTADPEISTIVAGLKVTVRPIASGRMVRAAVDVSVTDVADPIKEVELPIPVATPVKIQVPERKTRFVSRLVECAAGAFAVVDVGDGNVVLLRATPVPAPEQKK